MEIGRHGIGRSGNRSRWPDSITGPVPLNCDKAFEQIDLISAVKRKRNRRIICLNVLIRLETHLQLSSKRTWVKKRSIWESTRRKIWKLCMVSGSSDDIIKKNCVVSLHAYTKRVALVYLYHVNRCGHHKNLSIAKLDFVQVCGLSLNFYNNSVSFTNLATVGKLEQVQLCNQLIDQSADNITGLKCAKECLILKYKYIQNPCLYSPE